MHKQLLEKGIDSKLILDSSIGYMMEQVDIVMLGAEGVVESGGIINKVRVENLLLIYYLHVIFTLQIIYRLARTL